MEKTEENRSGQYIDLNTFGAKRVGLNLGSAHSKEVLIIKEDTAKLIDYLQSIRNDAGMANGGEESPEALKERAGEKFRLIALAQTYYETAAMYAVKAVTS